jgi:hypothetical protein
LAKLEPESRRQLTEASQSTDPEVRLRARLLLDRYKVQDLWSAGSVRCDSRGKPALEAFAACAEQAGNHVLVGEQYGPFNNAKLELDLSGGTHFWPAIDQLCQATGNRVRVHYDAHTPGIVVTSGAAGKYPVAYAGPIRAQITGARRNFLEDLDYETLKSDRTHTFQFSVQLIWEDRFRLVGYTSQPELVEAVTDTKAVVTAAQATQGSWNVAGTGTRQLTTTLRLNPPPASAKAFDVLKLKWGLIAVGDMATIQIDEPEARKVCQQEDLTLTIDSFERPATGRCEVTLTVARELAIPDPQEIVFQENKVELLDQQGRAYRLVDQTNSLSEQGVQVKLMFAGETPTSEAKQLRFSYPRVRARRDVELIFRDVPLPTGRPE